MKYISRKETPLKYHRFVVFFLIPLAMIFNGLMSYLMISGYLNLNTPGSAAWKSMFRTCTGINLSSPEGSWVYVAWLTAFFVILFVLDLKCWNGMFRWKKSGMNLWLLKNTALTVLIVGGGMMCLRELRSMMAMDLFVQMTAVQYGVGVSEIYSMFRTLQIVFLAAAIILGIFLVLNYVYYLKRRRLFRPFYAEPLSEPVRNVPDAEIPSAVPAVKRTAKLLYCPQCGRKLTESDINFCTECGANLKEE